MKCLVVATLLLTFCLLGCSCEMSNRFEDKQSTSISLEEGSDWGIIREDKLTEHPQKNTDTSVVPEEQSLNDTIQVSDEMHRKLTSLIRKNACTLTEEDFDILLNTPIIELHHTLDFPLPCKYDYWIMGVTVQVDKIPGLQLNAGYFANSDDIDVKMQYALPASFYIHNDGKVSGNDNMPLGYTFRDVMDIWGETKVGTTIYALGYSGEGSTPLEMLTYYKGKLTYDFTIAYNNVFSPKEEHDLIVDLITVRKTQPFEFLQAHVDIAKEIGQDDFAYMVSAGKRDSALEDYYIVSIGTNSVEKFTAMEHYYIKSDFSEILKANAMDADIIIWQN